MLANVAEAGDIVLYVMALGATLAVGLALLGIDTLVGRLRARSAKQDHPADPNA